jgi:hypothetical protein
MTGVTAVHAAKSLQVLKWFPRDIHGQNLVAAEIYRMCHSIEQAKGVVMAAARLYTNWEDCGVRGLRQILSAVTTPRDGFKLLSTTSYPEGVPADMVRRPSLPSASLQLPAGDDETAQVAMLERHLGIEAPPSMDPEIAAEVREAAATHAMPRPFLVPSTDANGLCTRPPAPKPEPMSPERRAELEAQLAEAQRRYQQKKAAGA